MCRTVFMQTTPQTRQTNRMFVSGRRSERQRRQDGSHFLICSWMQEMQKKTVIVHKGLEAKCEKYDTDFKCIWEVILYLIYKGICVQIAV